MNLVPILIAVCFAFATGILYAMSCVEKPVWSLMRDPKSDKVTNKQVRLIYAELTRVVKLLPPSMMVAIGIGTLLILVQTWRQEFSWQSLSVLAVLLVFMGYTATRLAPSIHMVSSVDPDSDIAVVRKGLSDVMIVHHMGLFSAACVLLLQVALVIGW